MNFTKQGNIHRVSRITGPRYNLLGVEFAKDHAVTQPTIEALPQADEPRHGQLDPAKILQAVLDGIHEGNTRFNTNYRVARVQYGESDTPPEIVYQYMATKLIEHLMSQQSE
ncbi:MAG TPA: hypothetical protein VJL59_03330 [Anaerolineales bacterium]|nr:hypothetical protein [Anaerolineales bacterium]